MPTESGSELSFVATLDNRTPLDAIHLLMPDGQGGEAVLLVVKSAFDIANDGTPHASETPAKVRLADQFLGEPARGYPLADSDLALHKPRVDVLIHGAVAYAPKGRPSTSVFVELHVGFPGGPASDVAAHDRKQAQLIKSLRVTGDRIWQDDAASEPLPFVSMPLGWERAYGGTQPKRQAGPGGSDVELDERNPFGIGWAGARSSNPEILGELPNLEDPEAPMVRRDSPCVPASFGVIGRAWLPRRKLAGTYDLDWQTRRWPLAPRDFDPAFHQSAPADQQLDRCIGGEPIRLVNLTPEGEWLFRIPQLDVPVHLLFEDRLARADLVIDTVEIEPEARRVTLTQRLAIPIVRGSSRLAQIVLGHVKPGWLRARASGKCFLDARGEAGSMPNRAWFR
jgi:hypothetical protein